MKIHGNFLKNIKTRLKNKFLTSPKKNSSPKLFPPTYLDRYRDRPMVVFGTGTSIQKYKRQLEVFIKTHNAVVIGTNNAVQLYQPDYIFFSNRKRFIENIHLIQPEKTKLLVGCYILPSLVKRHFKYPFEWVPYDYIRMESPLKIEDGIMSYGRCTTACIALVIAHVMGASEVYAAGLDGYSAFLEGKLSDSHINAGQAITKYEDHASNLVHYEKLQRLNEMFLNEFNELRKRMGLTPLKILTPTDYTAYSVSAL